MIDLSILQNCFLDYLLDQIICLLHGLAAYRAGLQIGGQGPVLGAHCPPDLKVVVHKKCMHLAHSQGLQDRFQPQDSQSA